MPKGRLVSLYSATPQQGKTTVAEYLEDTHSFRRIGFADPLKKMVSSFLISAGYTQAEARRWIEHDKEIALTRIPGYPTARFLMQTLGTEWGRHTIHGNLWVSLWEAIVVNYTSNHVSVVAEDCRFANEAEVTQRLGGKVWKIEGNRPINLDVIAHASEGNLTDWNFDRIIENADTLDGLYRRVDKAVYRRSDFGDAVSPLDE